MILLTIALTPHVALFGVCVLCVTDGAHRSNPVRNTQPKQYRSSEAPEGSTTSSLNPKKRSFKKAATKKTVKKTVTKAKKMRGRKGYTKNARKILFQKGKKGTKIVLKNSKGQVVKTFTVKKNGKFSIKLTKKQAKKLNKTKKGKKYFTFTVSQKGYKPYTVKYYIKK